MITAAATMIISRTKKPELEPDNAASNIFKKMCACGLTVLINEKASVYQERSFNVMDFRFLRF